MAVPRRDRPVLDRHLRPLIDGPLNRLGIGLAQAGITANAVTVLGLAVGLAAVPLLAGQHYGWALLCIVVSRILDGLDGAIARGSRQTDFGGYLDIVCDMIFYGGVVYGFALAQPHNAAWAALLLFSFMGTSASFLAWAAIAAKRGLETEAQGRKSFFYSAGLIEGSETIAFLGAFCLFPEWFRELAVAFAVLCGITVAGRIHAAARAFGGPG